MLKVFVLAALLAGPTPECVIASEAEFLEAVSTLKPLIFEAKPESLETILTLVNLKREPKGLHRLEADKMLLGVTGDRVGYVMFKDGCVVPGTVGNVLPADLIDFLYST